MVNQILVKSGYEKILNIQFKMKYIRMISDILDELTTQDGSFKYSKQGFPNIWPL